MFKTERSYTVSAWSTSSDRTNASERDQTIKMLDGIEIQTGRRGRPKTRPKQLAADKGYDSKELRRELRSRGVRPEIPHRVWAGRLKKRGRKLKRSVWS